MPTDVIHTVGSGGDFATLGAWESATQGDLVAADERRIAEVLDGTIESISGVVVSGSTTDATRHRVIRPRTNFYDIVTDVGPKIRTIGTSQSTTLQVDEGFLLVEGICFEDVRSAGDTSMVRFVDANSSGTVVDRCTFLESRTYIPSQTFNRVITWDFDIPAPSPTVRNSIILFTGSMGPDEAAFVGRNNANALDGCVVHNARLNGVSDSFQGTVNIRNTIVTDAGGACFFSGASGPRMQSCISSDGTASGLNSQTNQAAATLFLDHAAGDFRIRSGAASIDTGSDRSSVYTHDYAGTTRGTGGDWDVGPYDEASTPVSAKPISGTSSSAVAASAPAVVSKPVSGTASAALGASVLAAVAKSISGTASSAADITAALTVSKPISGTAAASAQAGIAATISRPISGASASELVVTASIEGSKTISGTSAAHLQASLSATVIRGISGTAASALTVTAQYGATVRISGTAAAGLSVTAGVLGAEWERGTRRRTLGGAGQVHDYRAFYRDLLTRLQVHDPQSIILSEFSSPPYMDVSTVQSIVSLQTFLPQNYSPPIWPTLWGEYTHGNGYVDQLFMPPNPAWLEQFLARAMWIWHYGKMPTVSYALDEDWFTLTLPAPVVESGPLELVGGGDLELVQGGTLDIIGRQTDTLDLIQGGLLDYVDPALGSVELAPGIAYPPARWYQVDTVDLVSGDPLELQDSSPLLKHDHEWGHVGGLLECVRNLFYGPKTAWRDIVRFGRRLRPLPGSWEEHLEEVGVWPFEAVTDVAGNSGVGLPSMPRTTASAWQFGDRMAVLISNLDATEDQSFQVLMSTHDYPELQGRFSVWEDGVTGGSTTVTDEGWYASITVPPQRGRVFIIEKVLERDIDGGGFPDPYLLGTFEEPLTLQLDGFLEMN